MTTAVTAGLEEQLDLVGSLLPTVMKQQEPEAVALQWDRFPVELIQELLELRAEEVLLRMEKVLGFTKSWTCNRDAVLFDFYQSGFCWAKEAKFTPPQIALTMAVLHMLLENLTEKQMSLVDNLVAFMRAVAVACHRSPDKGGSSLLDKNGVVALTDYVTKRLAAKYKLYKHFFTKSREEHVIRMERTIETFSPQGTISSLMEE
ncbi:PREDICTED: uncharacterized protein C10orf107 homolog isoform X1 [Cyprinodon variegatus]|uniref:uncharacterized protein C10orf107 homolog isoform X1 n=1 Tax=Cyprinodon variegatus TaxID=28743 RepID=UPI0007425EF8|nr:PREDICTED: uncharacterized protein C10orf107 homolog isoform X1 [Cyprinodon variegatus]